MSTYKSEYKNSQMTHEGIAAFVDAINIVCVVEISRKLNVVFPYFHIRQ